MSVPATITTRVLNGFDDPSFTPTDWERVLAAGQSDVVFLTWHWQSAWWETFGRGELLLIVAERDGDAVALAPFFAEAGMLYFTGSGGSDYLDFVGDISDPEILDALLIEARRYVSDFIGFVFYHVPESSGTAASLRPAAARLGLQIFEENNLSAPALKFGLDKTIAIEAANKKSLVRHERGFTREHPLKVEQCNDGKIIGGRLDEFFAQHIERWAATPTPSLFCDEKQKTFYRNLTRAAANAGWLRFMTVEWNGRPIAFHFGFCYHGNFLWYKPSFAVDLARRSPGEVLLRQLLLAAAGEGAHTFDFGLGDEPFKKRFANRTNVVRNWGLYDPGAIKG